MLLEDLIKRHSKFLNGNYHITHDYYPFSLNIRPTAKLLGTSLEITKKIQISIIWDGVAKHPIRLWDACWNRWALHGALLSQEMQTYWVPVNPRAQGCCKELIAVQLLTTACSLQSRGSPTHSQLLISMTHNLDFEGGGPASQPEISQGWGEGFQVTRMVGIGTLGTESPLWGSLQSC